MHSEGYEADEDVIYDGPAPGGVIHEGPASGALEPDQTHGKSDVPYRLVSNAQKDGAGSAAFKKGLASFRSHALAEALGSFEMAVSDEPDNAMYHYYLALTFHELYGSDAGIDILQQAVQLERREPIANWGKHMERVQGRSRLWIEKARRDAGLVR